MKKEQKVFVVMSGDIILGASRHFDSAYDRAAMWLIQVAGSIEQSRSQALSDLDSCCYEGSIVCRLSPEGSAAPEVLIVLAEFKI